MKKIGTHNSATGEQSRGLKDVLLVPFARCQGKTLAEQWRAGARLFDIRLRMDEAGVPYFAHGLWASGADAIGTLYALGGLAQETGEVATLKVSYEGRLDGYGEGRFVTLCKVLNLVAGLQVAEVCVKQPEWRMLAKLDTEQRDERACYEVLDGRNWRTLIPIPWLWYFLRGNKKVGEDGWRVVDFL